ncbi:calcium-activated potassium channel protein (macronuclear) [Tetrahymena thermophila SB210]|uniref:BK channel n=1 Tax=Tetrahymena thermophila (strain SB210) TaxID=312017 RepID=W7XG78_TETTS|nr:calcium-activated potassium channel protein [Tetrahymena thermophila SB210]EWS75923.1 calcium-activated potassium channel protein [Tetrahymena thermophila SB210]|eukprot:XP_012651548.1 calcium-activated potassium channel protein [Tetrahymena thermophila SB210]
MSFQVNSRNLSTQIKKSEIIPQSSTGNAITQKFAQMLEDQAFLNKVLDLINSLFSFIVIFQYIYSTYSTSIWSVDTWPITSTLFHAYFFFEWICRILTSKDINKYIKSWESVADLISIIPYFVYKFVTNSFIYEDYSDPYLLLINLLSLTRIMRLQRLLIYIDNDTLKELFQIILAALSLVILASGILQFTQRNSVGNIGSGKNSNQDIDLNTLPFHYYIYFVMITISTLGYDNPFNNSVIRILIIFLLIFSFIFVPQYSSKLINLLSKKSFFARRSYKVVESVSHVVVTGVVSSTAAENFFQELFHQDHGDQAKHALLLLPHAPDGQLENLLSNPNLFYMEGQPSNDNDLKRCQLEKAKSVIILCNKQSSDPHWEDSQTILRAMDMKKYLKSNIRFCTQLLRQEGKTHYYLSLQETQSEQIDQVICIEELKMSLLAKSCLCPGLIALVNNLITSSGSPTDNLEYKWLEDYWKGQGFEIYKVLLSHKYQGRTFSQAALSIYKNYKAILFGLELISTESSRLFLNPGSMYIPSTYEVIGYIIAEDKETADNISQSKGQNEENEFQDEAMNVREDIIDFTRKFYQKNSSLNSQNTPPKDTEMKLFTDDDYYNNDYDSSQIQDEQREEHLKNAIITGDWNKIYEKCYTSKDKIHLKDVSFESLENNILAQNHIILCGAVDNFINFIMPLRAKHLDNYPAIILLNDKEPTEKAWNLVSLFPNIYFVKGSALNQRDLIRANIQKAQTVVILASEFEQSFQDSNKEYENEAKKSMELTKEQEDLLDAKTIFKYKAVQKLKPDIQIVTEFVNPANIAFLSSDPSDYSLLKKFGYNHTPLFASGEIYISSMMDSLSAQAFYNPALIKVLNLILLGDHSHQQFWKKKKFDKSFNHQNSNLFHIKIPKAFQGKTFEKLFCFLAARQDIIVIALYRLSLCKDNKLPYVWTNPDPETILTDRDICFIFSQTPPQDYMEWGGPLEKNIQQKRKKKLKKHTSDSTQSENEEVPINYDEIERTNANTRQYIKDSELVSQKINQIAEKIAQVKENCKDLELMIQNRQDQIIDQLKNVIQDELNNIVKQKQQQNIIQQQQQQQLAQMQQQSQEENNNQLSDQSSLQPNDDYDQDNYDDKKVRLLRN